MTRISADRVLDEARALLASRPEAPLPAAGRA